jgi:hypothetical protein
MTQAVQRFVVADPRTFEGDPFEVADRAFAQAEAVARVLDKCIEDARVMARNAEMSRQLEAGGEADAAAFEDTVLARKIDDVRRGVTRAIQALPVLRRAAAFNPKAKIGRE